MVDVEDSSFSGRMCLQISRFIRLLLPDEVSPKKIEQNIIQLWLKGKFVLVGEHKTT